MNVANGAKLNCEEVILDIKLNVQDVCIIIDLRVLTIVGLDVVLGNAWLRSIEKVLHNFEDMTM